MNTKTLILSITMVGALLSTQIAATQAPAGAPANTTGLCNDGTYYTGASKQGACRGHKGVKEWYGTPGSASNSSKGAATTTQTPATSSSSAAPATTPAPATSSKTTAANSSKTQQVAQAPGGGADKVWLNTSTNVYHCPGTKYYGTTKAGAYMTEAEAKAKGGRPDHNKPCQ